MKGGRLQSIDALRGAAALAVVFYHVVGLKPEAATFAAASRWRWLSLPFLHTLSFGYTAVFLFFVISGFCIHLQWVRGSVKDAETRIDFAAFWKRRLRRLYPPYLIALALYLTISAWTSEVRFDSLYLWDVISRLLMLHNLDPRTVYSITASSGRWRLKSSCTWPTFCCSSCEGAGAGRARSSLARWRDSSGWWSASG